MSQATRGRLPCKLDYRMTKVMIASTPKKMGRPRFGKEPLEIVQARFDLEMIEVVDRWARERGMTRSDAIRRLVALGLRSAPGGGKGKR
jgi:hypothetical protein